MPYMVKINDSVSPVGSIDIVIFAMRAAVSEIQLMLTLNGKLALIHN